MSPEILAVAERLRAPVPVAAPYLGYSELDFLCHGAGVSRRNHARARGRGMVSVCCSCGVASIACSLGPGVIGPYCVLQCAWWSLESRNTRCQVLECSQRQGLVWASRNQRPVRCASERQHVTPTNCVCRHICARLLYPIIPVWVSSFHLSLALFKCGIYPYFFSVVCIR